MVWRCLWRGVGCENLLKLGTASIRPQIKQANAFLVTGSHRRHPVGGHLGGSPLGSKSERPLFFFRFGALIASDRATQTNLQTSTQNFLDDAAFVNACRKHDIASAYVGAVHIRRGDSCRFQLQHIRPIFGSFTRAKNVCGRGSTRSR